MLKASTLRIVFIGLFSLVLFASATTPQTAAAQTVDTSCLTGLSDADCQLLAAMEANMGTPQTFNVNYNVSLKASGISSLGAGKTVNLTITGAGLASTAGITELSLPTIIQNLQLASSMHLVANGLSNVNLNEQIDFRLVDGALYIQGPALNKSDGWLKVTLADQTAVLGQASDISPLINDFTPHYIRALCACTSSDISRGSSQAGPKIDGKASKQISAIFDFGAAYDQLKTDVAKKVFLTELMSHIAPSATLNLNNPAQLAAILKTIHSSMLQYSWFVTPDDQMYHGFSVKVSFYLDPLLVNSNTAGSAKTAETLNAEATVILSKIGRTVDIPAGTGKVTDITDQLMQGLSSFR